MKIKGYNDKQMVLLKKIVERMVTLEMTQDRFDIMKKKVSASTKASETP